MNIEDKLAQFHQERATLQETKDKAHKRIKEINLLIRKLETVQKDALKILVDEPGEPIV